jgi:acetyl-CoA carboxylase biotin carboxyl carrier protein
MRSADSEPQASAPEQSTVDYHALTETVRVLVQIMRDGGVDHLDVSQGDLHIHLSSRATGDSPGSAPACDATSLNNAPAPASGETSESVSETFTIAAPMVGTYYEAPSPGERPFIVAGDQVEAGQTVAIIEAMKIMNEIVADRPGIVDAVLVQNGETVEYGHPLFRLRPL